MNKTTPSASKPVQRGLWTHTQVWVWSAILMSALVCLTVSWLHVAQQRTLQRALEALENIRQARIDLNKGFLHTSLAAEPGSAFGAAEGAALMRQATDSFNEAATAENLADDEVRLTFQQSVTTFESALAEWRKNKSQPGITARLRVAFNDLEIQAARMDTRIHGRLRNLSDQSRIAFSITMCVAVLLQTCICVMLLFAYRAREKFAAASLKIEEELRENRQFLLDLIENSGALVFVKDLQGRYQMVNRKWEEVAGMLRQSVIGRNDMELFPSASAECFQQNDRQVIESGMLLEKEEFLERGAGKRFFISIKFPLRSRDNSIKGVCGMITEITERKQMEMELRDTAEQKNALIREIHHRVKNNLAIMTSLINLQVRQVQHEETLVALEETKSRLNSICVLHEMLYRSGQVDHIRIRQYMEQLCMHLSRSLGISGRGIQLLMNGEDFTLEINTAVPCGLIVNELASNAVKHGFPDRKQGEIRVEWERLPNSLLLLRVEDNGQGIPDHITIEKSVTLGLKLVTILTQQLHGKLELRRSNPTRFEIQCPLRS